jgi:predicted transcriptional regulator
MDACRVERNQSMVENFKLYEREREFFESSDKKVIRAKLRKKINSEMHLHELALEARRDRSDLQAALPNFGNLERLN